MSVRMRAGSMPHRVEIQAATTIRGGAGSEVVAGWTTIAERWAAVEPVTGREYWSSEQKAMELTHEVVLRFDASLPLRSKMRILFGCRILQIEVIRRTNEWGGEWRLQCREMEATSA